MQPTVSLIIIFLLFGCSRGKQATAEPSKEFTQPQVSKIDKKYLFTIEQHHQSLWIYGTGEFQLLGSKINKRVGGYYTSVLGIPTYTPERYDTVTYASPNEIIVTTTNMDRGAYTGPFSKRHFLLEDGLIKRKITFDETTPANATDTIFYNYDGDRKLINTEQLYVNLNIRRQFFYTGNNLQRIVHTFTNRIDGSTLGTTEETFGGYDNKPNPLKGQTLWQDILYRTLSKNNFTTYRRTSGTFSESKSWSLVYDAAGNVDFSQ